LFVCGRRCAAYGRWFNDGRSCVSWTMGQTAKCAVVYSNRDVHMTVVQPSGRPTTAEESWLQCAGTRRLFTVARFERCERLFEQKQTGLTETAPARTSATNASWNPARGLNNWFAIFSYKLMLKCGVSPAWFFNRHETADTGSARKNCGFRYLGKQGNWDAPKRSFTPT